jgi:phenylacetate-CoA ligase
VNTIWSAADVETITKVTMRTLWQFGVRPGDVIQNAFAYGLWVAGLSCHYVAARLGCLVVPTGTATTTQKQIDFLRSVGSTVLLSTPSYALHVAEGLQEQGIDPADLPLRLGRGRPDLRFRVRGQSGDSRCRGLRGRRVPRPRHAEAGAGR